MDISQTSRTPKYANVTATPNVIAISPYALASARRSDFKGGERGGRVGDYPRINIKSGGHRDIAFPREKDTRVKLFLYVAREEEIHTLILTKQFFFFFK